MFGFSCGSACNLQQPATSTVKVSLADITEMPKVEEERLAREPEMAEEARRKEAEEELRLKAEEAERLVEEQRREQAERRRQEEEQRQREEAEEAQRVAEAAAAAAAEAAAARAAEEEKFRQEQALQATNFRKKQVSIFLKKEGFTDVNARKRSLLSSTYPLHKAAEAGNAKLVSMLLAEGANPAQKNSSGRTAAQVAFKQNKSGSHSKVISLLQTSSAAPRMGGA